MKKYFLRLAWLRQMLINADAQYKLGAIGFIVGITSGLAAIGLNFSLKFFHHHTHKFDGALWMIIFPVFGLIITVILLKYIIKDFEGHGLPEVIHSISLKGGNLKFRSSFSKLLGSLVTISSGCSAGPEAPVTVSGAAIGSNIARFFKADDKVKVAVTGSGAAAAIAAIFNAPITGIIFTMEVIIGDWAPVYMLPVAIASVTGTEISRLLNGNQIPFTHTLNAVTVYDIIVTLGLAIVCAIVSILFIRALRYTSMQLEKYFKSALFKAIVGGLFIGLISFKVPHIRGEGYEFVQQLISGEFSAGIAAVFLIVVLKIVATSVTLGAGGAGGVFAPALVIGSSCGFLFYAILHSLFPALPAENYGLFALVGMSGVISGTLSAPLTGIFLVIEITRGYDAILPLLLVAFITTALVKIAEKHSIYHYELVKKGFLLRPRTDGRILADIKPRELLEQDLITIRPELLLREIIPTIKKSKRNYFPVVDKKDNRFCGMVYFNDLKEFIFNSDMLNSILVEEVMHSELTTISLSDSLIDIQEKFEKTKSWSLPVVEDGKFKGLISKATMLDLYRKELRVQTDK
ncbi:MAG: chloride channel protein [Deferribacteres bacterium]|nr:chloride channel protein [candidate division KSB1 bacterium]MCB9500744.1 chloride channel protein [Deferribacteres bacterium]